MSNLNIFDGVQIEDLINVVQMKELVDVVQVQEVDVGNVQVQEVDVRNVHVQEDIRFTPISNILKKTRKRNSERILKLR